MTHQTSVCSTPNHVQTVWKWCWHLEYINDLQWKFLKDIGGFFFSSICAQKLMKDRQRFVFLLSNVSDCLCLVQQEEEEQCSERGFSQVQGHDWTSQCVVKCGRKLMLPNSKRWSVTMINCAKTDNTLTVTLDELWISFSYSSVRALAV